MNNSFRTLAVATVAITAMFLVTTAAQAQSQKTFATPEEAVKAAVAAAKADNKPELIAIFGPEAEEILSSGDPVADRQQRQVVLAAFTQGWRVENRKGGGKEVIVGDEDWPFPIPLVKETAGWRFDTAAGKEEVLARRIGRNELSVIGICRTYGDGQKVYASAGHDGKPAGTYAQKIRSEAGKQDGLYWATKPGEPLSPLGELAAEAAEEGYKADPSKTGPQPFHGYYFRILTAQGAAAPGGAKSYVVNGDMTGGYALVAWPAEYANSGIMTFTVNHDGILYQKDLGEETAKMAGAMKEYNPDKTWKKVK